MDVRKSTKGPQIFLSRTHPGFVERLFELEVPEIEDGDSTDKEHRQRSWIENQDRGIHRG